MLLLPIDHMLIQDSADMGRAIRSRRKELMITQQEIADVVGVNRRVISELESGKETVQLRIVLETARTLGLNISLDPRN